MPWWMWGFALALAVMLAAQVGLGAPGPRTWVPYSLLIPLAVAGMWWLGRIRIAVKDGELWVDDAHLPVEFVADVIPLDPDGKRTLMGPGADPLAFVVQRPWIRGSVQVLLDDPQDPTPYWLISTRHPERLTEAVLAARAGAARLGDQTSAAGRD